MEKKEYILNAVRMIEIDGSKCIPSILLYKPNGKVLIGFQAEIAKNSRKEINEDFKIDLGEIDPKLKDIEHHKKFCTANDNMVAATKLTNDFLYELLKETSNWMEANDLAGNTNILFAEPVAMQTDILSSDWLSKYRDNLRRILKGKLLGGKRIEDVDFLPEPFAVFQYYRHGYRHPLVSARTKYNVIVIDFGGGTFDVCIIETSSKGDISQTGRNSKPLAASSDPIGGYFINKAVAKTLIIKYAKNSKERTDIKKGIGLYDDWRRGKISYSYLKAEQQNFINNFHELIYEIENTKLAICRFITDWRLDSNLINSAPINLPENPFSIDGRSISVQLHANELKNIFVQDIWDQFIKPIIKRALKRGMAELLGAPISVVLLSGGSANIGWLRELLRRDFAEELGYAEVLALPDFQEVVSKGLAVECARRYYNEGEGDFSSVTYNRLCLILDPDSKGYNLKSFKPLDHNLPDISEIPGVLLRSASILNKFIDKPMRWKVRLDKSPKNKLDYYFLRSSLNPEELDNLQNIEEKTLFTPSHLKSFDSNLKLELLVKQDGTAYPKFIYRTGRSEEESIWKQGKPFFLDMTSNQMKTKVKAYVGLDFGTSYTSISYIDEPSITSYVKRSEEKYWTDLNDLQSLLPYPLSAPLALYLSESNPSKLIDRASDFIEASLAMAAYIAYIDYCINKGRGKTKILKNFSQNSAGPLWGLLKNSIESIKKKNTISSPYKELLSSDFKDFIEEGLNIFAGIKHKKVGKSELDHLRLVQILANVSQKVFSNWNFGYFENVEKQRFGSDYVGIFRHALGKAPFIKISSYGGSIPFSKDQAFLVNIENRIAISLQPLIFWESCEKHPDSFTDHCYLFDMPEKDGSFTYKSVGFTCSCKVSANNQYSNLAEEIRSYREADPKIALMHVKLSE